MISLMVAMSSNKCIGVNDTLPWKQRNDLQRFKAMTLGKVIVIGKNTFKSFQWVPLPDRTHYVITSNRDAVSREMNMRLISDRGVFFAELKDLKEASKENDLMICGGAQIYKQVLDLGIVDIMHITELDATIEGDAFFPDVDMSKWKLVASEEYKKDDKNQYDYKFLTYLRRDTDLVGGLV